MRRCEAGRGLFNSKKSLLHSANLREGFACHVYCRNKNVRNETEWYINYMQHREILSLFVGRFTGVSENKLLSVVITL